MDSEHKSSLPVSEKIKPGPISESPSKVMETTYDDKTYPSDESRIEIKSFFFEWSCEYFSDPQMKVLEADDPGTAKFNEKLWRKERNESVLAAVKELKIATGMIFLSSV